MIPPGCTIGILGGGQLGRMLAIAAANLGYRSHIYAPGVSGPASEVAARWTRGSYDNAAAIAAFAAQVDVLTYEFENVDVAALAPVPGVAPNARALAIAQDRLEEKQFVAGLGGRPARFAKVDSLAELDRALAEIGAPAVLKTRRWGYDGKGQVRILDRDRAESAWAEIKGAPAVLEAMVPFEAEFSILIARGRDEAAARYPAVENVHRGGILERSTVPAAAIPADQADDATRLAEAIAAELDYVGVLACEFFATGNGPVFNEMAPRVHNSGHWTIEGAVTSQFENHIRAICGLPLGSTELTGASVEMRNLIGNDAEGWLDILSDTAAHLHLYGKDVARPGRKMGHVTRIQR